MPAIEAPKAPTTAPAVQSAPATPTQVQDALKANQGSESEGFDMFGALDNLPDLVTEPKKAPEKHSEPKVEPKTEQKDTPKVEEKPVAKETPKVEEKPKVEDKPLLNPRDLRIAYDKTKTELATLRGELEALKANPAPKNDHPDTKALMDRLTAEEKRRKEVETELASVNYEKSQEYQEKFQAPMKRAFDLAYQEIQHFPIVDAEGNQRKADAQDFQAILYLPANQALAKAKEMFGDAAPEVMAHRREILAMNQKRLDAIEEHNKTGAEREANRKLDQERQLNEVRTRYETTIKEQVEKYPQFFAPEEGDEEGNKILDTGHKVAELAFDNSLPLDQQIKVKATVKNKAAAFDREVLRRKRAEAKLAEVQAKLDEFEKSVPGKSDGTSTPAEDDSSMSALIDKLPDVVQ